MITEWLISLGVDTGGWLLTLLPALPSDFLEGAVGTTVALGGFVGTMGVWVNWVLVSWLVAESFAVYLLMMTVRIIRALIGHVPFVGGNG